MDHFKQRFPEYDVLAKWDTPSWNDQTRKVVAKRINEIPERRFFDPDEFATLEAVCGRVIPQPDRPDNPVPIAPFIDEKLFENQTDGTRYDVLPPLREAWRQGLSAIEGESRIRFEKRFADLSPEQQDLILRDIQNGRTESPAWQDMPPEKWFASRMVFDIVSVYYAHPASWNEIGFGGPASPRGYVRLRTNRHDPWEAREMP